MPKHYDPLKREAALVCLAALGDTRRTSELTGISSRTLRRWAQEERLAQQSAVKMLTRETERAADAAEIHLREAQARLEQTQAQLEETKTQLAQVRQEQVTLQGAWAGSPHVRLQQLALENMLQEATRLSASLGEAIEDAPLGQRATALNQLLDKVLKVLALAQGNVAAQEEVRVRVEFQDADGSLHETPFWARADSEE